MDGCAYQIPLAEFLHTLRKTNFTSTDSCAEFLETMKICNTSFTVLDESNPGSVFTGYTRTCDCYLWPNTSRTQN
jgi:hypothetical protein